MTNNKDSKKYLIRLVIIFVVLLFYIWTTTEGYFTFSDRHYYRAYYNALASAFSFGRLDLNIVVPPKLKNLKDPYNYNIKHDPELASFYDFSYYKEKLYLYFGPTPAITVILPYHWIVKFAKLDKKYNLNYYVTFPPNGFVVLVYIFGVFIFGVLILLHLKDKYFKDTPEWMFIISILLIAFCNIGGYLLRRPYFYEIAVSGGCFFFLGGIYFLLLSLSKGKASKFFLFLAGIFLGLSIGSRAILLGGTVGILIYLIWWKYIKGKQITTGQITSLVFPLVVLLAALGIYNFLRFDNIFETGFNYQLGPLRSPFDNKRLFFAEPETIFHNIYCYLLMLPTINHIFPFIHAKTWMAGYFEKIVGLFTGTPFALLMMLSPYLYLKSKNKLAQNINNVTFPKTEFVLILLPALINIMIYILFRNVTLRYTVDFSTLIIIATCIIWFYYDAKLASYQKYRELLKKFSITTAILSIIIGITLSIEGSQSGLIEQNPKLYNSLEKWFSPISKTIMKFEG